MWILAALTSVVALAIGAVLLSDAAPGETVTPPGPQRGVRTVAPSPTPQATSNPPKPAMTATRSRPTPTTVAPTRTRIATRSPAPVTSDCPPGLRKKGCKHPLHG